MKSKFNSKCPFCDNWINKGDEIDKRGEKWGHAVCPEKSFQSPPGPNPFKSNGRNIPVNVSEEGSGTIQINWIPSKYQVAYFEALVNSPRNIVMQAVAGAGKTTTEIKSLEYIPLAVLMSQGKLLPMTYDQFPAALDSIRDQIPQIMQGHRVAFVAFNKSISMATKSKLQQIGVDYVHCSTVHSLGYSICRKLPELDKRNPIDKDKVSGFMKFWPIAKDEAPELKDRIKNKIKRALMRKVVSLAKNTLADWNSSEAIINMAERYNIDDTNNDLPEIIEKLPFVMQSCIDNCETVDFDDQIWLPVVHPRLKNHAEKFPFIFGDETQDWNLCQIELIKKCMYPYSRFIGVGDENQSLYGFRGADTEAIARLIREFDAITLPLSITYRCPRLHVEMAQKLVPSLEAADNAIEGEFGYQEYDDFLEKIEPGDLVMCRTNAPLVKPAFEAIRGGKKAVIRGMDIGRDLITFVEQFQATNLNQLDTLMEEYREKEVDRLIKRDKELQADLINDKVQTIREVAGDCKTVSDLTNKLETLFSDEAEGILFSSVHRAKGLEADRTFILRRELMPHPRAKQDWELAQEQNTLYVALTRSKREMYFVRSE